ncbi:TPA: FMN-binding glutamate synthase family protein [Legionella pneumophila subsp. pneumophila]|uniref:FMN-binding glutamate synthase family protein n=1 Tax=Legionella pneumophila TaxID=446 RepID=UPI000770B0B3|nr:FMN-binding glutamate synthase family protein [Legionella pneumophila]HAT9213743.1 FMN-binding glutamate synthase family protein [Legionella pneumophila subsp. pneumophila]CZI26286.1 Glutamate synthase [NADPH] large chain precursor [Legionella pneumophila]HAT9260149.1 FMN-binding glutamate synthase family protein [Legionella pneumophila subsp. pneumophila]HAT9281700.1 FMN-binding glutamate synthase family protein [Legionella pneumophila subsp. pneumophila]HAT9289153.1 FMN-binding glutamate 
MRRQWYIGFGVILLCIFALFVMLQDIRWFFAFFIPIIILWIYDVLQTKHTILRNFPVLGHVRYFLEFLRPEIQQYFIATDESELPFNRETRSMIYQRAKNVRDTIPFGTERDILSVGYTWALHSLSPKHSSEVEPRIDVGGPDCKKPYNASRLNISAMSFGSLSSNAIMALNKGAKLGGFYHNTGEGGLSPYHLQGGDIVFQIGTAYFGCRDDKGDFDENEFIKEASRDEVKMIEIKLSQGAKPSHGGILPAAKLTEEIAKVRKVPMGKDVLSPIAHTAFDNPVGLLHFVKRLRDLSGGKPIGFKLCLGRRHEFMAICKAMLQTNILPDFITIDGAEGGTGAAPVEYTNFIGTPLEAGLVFVHNALVGAGVRDKIRVICSGKVTNGFDLLTNIALGADICNSARAMMMAIGCIQSKQCNANTCPTGVATQKKRLQYGLVVDQKKFLVANFHNNTIKSFLEMVGALGLNNPSDLKPSHIMRRIGVDEVKSFDQIYTYVKPGQFLQGDIPDDYRIHWEYADPDKF